MTPAGDMNRRVQIMRQGDLSGAATEDAYGQPDTATSGGWTEIRRPWAKIDPANVATGGHTSKVVQVFGAGEFTSRVQTAITIRYGKNDRITPADRVVFTEPGTGLVHTYLIIGVVNVGQLNENLLILCEELDGGA